MAHDAFQKKLTLIVFARFTMHSDVQKSSTRKGVRPRVRIRHRSAPYTESASNTYSFFYRGEGVERGRRERWKEKINITNEQENKILRMAKRNHSQAKSIQSISLYLQEKKG